MRVLISSKSREQVEAHLQNPQNLIISGEKGIGKRLVAEMLAAAWLKCSEAELGRHPDFGFIGPDGAGIKKAQIDEMAEVFSLQPSAAAKRVILIDDASSMNKQSMNALLKPLEDNAEWLAFILVAHSPLISTIESRCHKLRLSVPDEKELEAFLGEPVDPVCFLAAGGRIGRYFEYRGNKDFRGEMETFIKFLRETGSKFESLSVVGGLKEKDPGYYPERFKEELEGVLYLIKGIYFAHFTALSAGNPGLEQPLMAGSRMMGQYDLSDTAKVLGEVSRCLKLREQGKYSKNDFFRLISVMAGREILEG